MQHPADPNSYTWYAHRFCQDLGLCTPADQDWGSANTDPAGIARLARYYLEHTEFGRVGREMLIDSILTSAADAMQAAPLTPAEDEVLLAAVTRAIADPYDRDSVRVFWNVEDRTGDPNPLYHWLRARLPAWSPQPSVWSKDP